MYVCHCQYWLPRHVIGNAASVALLDKVCSQFVGRHHWHNFTSGTSDHDNDDSELDEMDEVSRVCCYVDFGVSFGCAQQGQENKTHADGFSVDAQTGTGNSSRSARHRAVLFSRQSPLWRHVTAFRVVSANDEFVCIEISGESFVYNQVRCLWVHVFCMCL